MNRVSRVVRMVSVLAMCAVVVFSSGCATPIALTSKTPTPNVSPGSGLVLLTIETSRDDAGGVHRLPVVGQVSLAPAGTKKATAYSVPRDVVTCESNVVTHLISFSLTPGEYEIKSMQGYGLMGREFADTVWNSINRAPFGNFGPFALNVAFSPIAGKIIYIGHIKAHMRQRNSENEPPAASVIPLIDQRVAGFYPSTFDIAVTDDFENDINRFCAKFPLLKKEDIGKSPVVRNAQ